MKTLGLLVAGVLLMAGPAFAQKDNPVVVMETSMGTIKIELDAKRAPNTVKNFLDYVDAKHYDGTIFHRVIPNFMIQGGGFSEQFKEKATKDPIKNESGNGLTNDRGTIAMARTPNPHSASDRRVPVIRPAASACDRTGPSCWPAAGSIRQKYGPAPR